jgi:hypothetical protein
MDAIEKYGPGIQAASRFVAQLDPAVRTEAFKFLLAHQFNKPVQPSERESGVPALPASRERQLPDRTLAPQELLRRAGASTTFEKSILFGYWLEMHQGENSFSGGKLKEVFEAAREQVPANPSDVVAKLERAGKLMRAEKVGGAQHYRLTRTAIEEIESKLK